MDAATFEAHFATASRQSWVIAAGILMDPHAADDVLQEAAVVAWQKRAEFAPGSSFGAWVGQIARNISLRHRESRRRRQSAAIDLVDEPASTLAAGGGPDARDATPADLASAGREMLERLGLSASLTASLLSLDPTARACLLLRTILDCDYSEIAQLLDLPEGTAMSHVHRSRRRLVEQLPDRAAAMK
jgi:RNA polymerase sigma-70 factor, ECF subfamily